MALADTKRQQGGHIFKSEEKQAARRSPKSRNKGAQFPLNPSFRKIEDKLNFCHIFYGTVNFFDNIFSMLLNNFSSLAKVVP
jgi:hypothetical protein